MLSFLQTSVAVAVLEKTFYKQQHLPYIIIIYLRQVIGERDTLRSVQLKIGDIYIMVRAISVYSTGMPYVARFTAAVKIPVPLATFQF